MLILLIVFFPFVSSLLSFAIGRKREAMRDYFVIFVTGAELLLTVLLFSSVFTGLSEGLEGHSALSAFYGFFMQGMQRMPEGFLKISVDHILVNGISFTTDGFRCVYAIITAVMWAGTALFSREYFKEERENLNRYWFFVVATLGATEGVMLSGDLLTSFLFFEILSFTSFTWVIHEETEGAVRAGYTYLFIAVIGGLILFMGLSLLYARTGTLSYAELREACAGLPDRGMLQAAGVCILLGFGAKAGMVPVHVWLPKAHPVAPSPASALLSGILTKVGVYGILMTSMTALWGNETFGLLVLLCGVITMALGAVLALFSINLKRTLACSSMSQIGFILTGAGMMELLCSAGSEEGLYTAMCGLMLHMVNHSLIKLTLFMAAGVVVMNLHTLTLDDIRGWGRNKLFLKLSFALGALGISGVPMFNGYLSKTLLHEGIVEGIHHLAGYRGLLHVVEWVFLISGGFTFAYMLKLFICVFVEKNKDPERQQLYGNDRHCMNSASTLAVFGSSLLMLILGQPSVSTRIAGCMSGYEEILHFQAFSLENLKGGLISLSIGAFVYLVPVRRYLMQGPSYVNRWPEKLDLEETLYRPVLTKVLPGIFGPVASFFGENKVLRPLASGFFPAVPGTIAAFLGENRILRPVCRFGMFAGTVLVRAMDMGMDGLIVLLRASVLKERKARGRKAAHPGLFRTISAEISGAAKLITTNFTFALMMTCIGIIVILCAIVLAVI